MREGMREGICNEETLYRAWDLVSYDLSGADLENPFSRPATARNFSACHAAQGS